MKPKVYIDGKEGTTGLQIYDRLASRDDIELLLIDETKRKDPDERKKLINAADITFLCLPDAAAKEAVSFVEKDSARIIDASTAHRTAPGWAYGIPELSDMHKDAVVHAKFTANPGCHASGFVIPVYPLVASGMIPKETPLTVFSLTGYSGGGKKMIAEYESPEKPELYNTPRIYGLNLKHKHLPEMQKICGLDVPPVFCPIVDDYYKGMAVTVMLQNSMLKGNPTAKDIHECAREIIKIMREYDVQTAQVYDRSNLPRRVEAFLAAKRIDGCRPKTIKGYRERLKLFMTQCSKPVQQITTDDLREYLAYLVDERHLMDNSVQAHINTLRSFFSWLVDEDNIRKSPMRKIKSLKIDKLRSCSVQWWSCGKKSNGFSRDCLSFR